MIILYIENLDFSDTFSKQGFLPQYLRERFEILNVHSS